MAYKDTKQVFDAYRGAVLSTSTEAMTPEEQERVNFLRNRWHYMYWGKTKLQVKFSLEKALYEVYEDHLQQGEQWGKAYRFPEAFGAVQRKYSDLLENMPQVKAKAFQQTEHVDNALAMNATVDHVKRNTNYERERSRALFDATLYGTGILFIGYQQKQQEVVEVNEDDPNLFLKQGTKALKTFYDGIAYERVDPRDLFVDHQAYVFWDETYNVGARDCVRRRMYPYSTFRELFTNNPTFKNTDMVIPTAWGADPFGLGKIPYEKETTEQKTQDKYVTVLEYWNRELDWLTLNANGIEIYFGANPFRDKRLPFSLYYNFRRDDSVWGVSEVEVIAPHIYARETLMNLMIDDAKLALQPALAVSGDVSFNPEENELQPGAIFTLRGISGGKVQDSIMPLRFGGVTADAVQVKQMIDDNQIIVTGDDTRALYQNPQQLATQTLAKRESLQKRIRSNVKQNTFDSEKATIQLTISRICQFYSKPYEDINGKMVFRRVHIPGYDVRQPDEDTKPEFTLSYGAESVFILNKEAVGQPEYFELEVIDSALDEDLRKEELQKLLQFLAQIVSLTSLGQIVPDQFAKIMQRLDIVALLQQIGEKLALNVDAIFPKEQGLEAGQDEVDQEHEFIVMGIVPQPKPDEDFLKHLERHRAFLKEMEKNPKKYSKEVKAALVKHIILTIQAYVNAQNLKAGNVGSTQETGLPPQGTGGTPIQGQGGTPSNQGGAIIHPTPVPIEGGGRTPRQPRSNAGLPGLSPTPGT